MKALIIPFKGNQFQLKCLLNELFVQFNENRSNFDDLKIIVVNDEKDDNLKQLREAFPQFHFYTNNRNKGANGARNTGLELVKKKFSKVTHVCFFDSDDNIMPGFIKALRLENFKEQYHYSNHLFIGNKNYSSRKKQLSKFKVLELNKYGPPIQYFLSIKQLTTQHIYWDESFESCQDWEFFIRVFGDDTNILQSKPGVRYKINSNHQ